MTTDEKDKKTIPFNLGYKVWLEKDDGIQGDGFFQILRLIDQSGSISGAATTMGMSYRAAWGKIKNVEQKWNMPLVITKVGGKDGGGASLTPDAVRLLENYNRFKNQVDKEINVIFEQVFKV